MFRWLGKALNLRPTLGGGAQLSVGKSTHVNYLLLVQQEMMNDNKLGKEKQQNKHFFSSSLPPFFKNCSSLHPFCLPNCSDPF